MILCLGGGSDEGGQYLSPGRQPPAKEQSECPQVSVLRYEGLRRSLPPGGSTHIRFVWW